MLKVHLEENKCFGKDSRGINIMLYAFEPLKVLQKHNSYSIVKPLGRGNYREYLVSNDELITCRI